MNRPQQIADTLNTLAAELTEEVETGRLSGGGVSELVVVMIYADKSERVVYTVEGQETARLDVVRVKEVLDLGKQRMDRAVANPKNFRIYGVN